MRRLGTRSGGRRGMGIALGLGLIGSASVGSFAQDAAALRLRSLAATCAACHGTDGVAPAGSAMRGLAGMPAPYFVEQMQAFKTGVRPGTVMPQLANGFSDAQIGALAGYFAERRPGALAVSPPAVPATPKSSDGTTTPLLASSMTPPSMSATARPDAASVSPTSAAMPAAAPATPRRAVPPAAALAGAASR